MNEPVKPDFVKERVSKPAPPVSPIPGQPLMTKLPPVSPGMPPPPPDALMTDSEVRESQTPELVKPKS